MIKHFIGEHEFLSNSYRSTFLIDHVKYRSVSHAYYSLRAKDEQDAIRIREFEDVKQAVLEGKKVVPRDTWVVDCRSVMLNALRQKFSNPFLKARLLDTGSTILGDKKKNFVGELLMLVRDELKEPTHDEFSTSGSRKSNENDDDSNKRVE